MLAWPLRIIALACGIDSLWCWFFGAERPLFDLIALPQNRFMTITAIACAAIVLQKPLEIFHRWWRLFLFAVAVLLSNNVLMSSTDNATASILPSRLLIDHTFAVEKIYIERSNYDYAWANDGHAYSRSPVGTPLLATPLYIPPTIGGAPETQRFRDDMQKLAAAILAALQLLMLDQVFRAVAGHRHVGVTLVFLVSSSFTVIVGQALWQHCGATFGVSLALFGAFARRSDFIAGLGLGVAVACRSLDLLFLLPFAIAVLVWTRSVSFVLGGLLPMLLVLHYNNVIFGHPLSTGYGGEATRGWVPFGSREALAGFAGLFVSPARGFFLFTPHFAFAAWAIAKERKLFPHYVGVSLGVGALVFSLALAHWHDWHGGFCAGPRMWAAMTPIFGLGLALLARDWHQVPRRSIVAACVWAIALHLLVLFNPTGGREHLYNLKTGAWDIRAHPFLDLLE